jgi:hypothetical protein
MPGRSRTANHSAKRSDRPIHPKPQPFAGRTLRAACTTAMRKARQLLRDHSSGCRCCESPWRKRRLCHWRGVIRSGSRLSGESCPCALFIHRALFIRLGAMPGHPVLRLLLPAPFACTGFLGVAGDSGVRGGPVACSVMAALELLRNRRSSEADPEGAVKKPCSVAALQ